GNRHGNGDSEVLANVVAIGGNGCELTGPERDRVGGVGLDGEHFHTQHCREQEERSSAGHGVEHTGQKRRDGEPEPVPVHVGGKGEQKDHLFSILEGGVAAGWGRISDVSRIKVPRGGRGNDRSATEFWDGNYRAGGMGRTPSSMAKNGGGQGEFLWKGGTEERTTRR